MSETTDLIKRLRASGLSQSEISRRTGIPQPRLSRWESGVAPVGADDALKLDALVREVLPPAVEAAPGPREPALAPASAMLLGGRREDDHVADSGFGALDHNGPQLAAEIDAIGKLVGAVPKRAV